jgi:hypothetical protein
MWRPVPAISLAGSVTRGPSHHESQSASRVQHRLDRAPLVHRAGCAKYPATLPEGWDRIEVDRVWVKGEAKRLVAVNVRPARLLEADR